MSYFSDRLAAYHITDKENTFNAEAADNPGHFIPTWKFFTEADKGDISINYLSTNGPPAFGHPYKYAKHLNERLPSLEGTLKGWVIVDFGTPALASLIYNEN